MKIDPRRLQLASAIESDNSDSDSSREDGEIRSVDLPPPPLPVRDPRHEQFYRVQDELWLRIPEFVDHLTWAHSLKKKAGGQPTCRSSPVNLPRPSSLSTTPVHSPRTRSPRHAPHGARASSFVLEKSPQRVSDKQKNRSRSCSRSRSPRADRHPPTQRKMSRRDTDHRVFRSPPKTVCQWIL